MDEQKPDVTTAKQRLKAMLRGKLEGRTAEQAWKDAQAAPSAPPEKPDSDAPAE